MNWAALQILPMSWLVSPGMKRCRTASSPYLPMRYAEVSVTEIGHMSANSDCTNRYCRMYFAVIGVPLQPSTPGRRDMAWMPKSPNPICSISR